MNLCAVSVERVRSAFFTEGEFLRAKQIDEGHINGTYVLWYGTENGERRYVLQHINRHVFSDVPAMMENIVRVTEHLAGRSLVLVRTTAGTAYHVDDDGEYWRLYDFVTDGRTLRRAATVEEARQAAYAFGDFSKALEDLPGGPLHDTIPQFHDTEARFAALMSAISRDEQNRAASVQHELAFAERNEPLARALRELHERAGVQPRVVHNDTKINNVILSRSGRGGTVIDLDTVMPGFALYDAGDLLRTGAATAAEDEENLDLVGIALALVEAICEGFRQGIGSTLSPIEAANIVTAGKVLAFETGMRFLTDYLDGDRYFRIRHPKHNLVRARNQFALTLAFAEHEELKCP